MSTDALEKPADAGSVGQATVGVSPPSSVTRVVKFEQASNWLGWALVAALIVSQFVLFRQFARREVTWNYPPNHDQLHFLDWSYLSAQQLHPITPRSLELAAGLRNSDPRPAEPGVVEVPVPSGSRGGAQAPPTTEMMFTLEGAILFRIFGPGRLTALTLNFLHFALFQCVLVATIRWLTGLWGLALLALGLLLAAATPFLGAGGLFDFRMDFSALCFYGIFLCLVVRSGIFTDRPWSIVAGMGGAILFTSRFLTILYLVGTLGLLLGFLILRWWRQKDPERRRAGRKQILNALLASAIIGVVSLPLLLQRYDALKAYYVVGHLTGPEKKVRAQAEGIKNIKEALAYYPKSLYLSHTGPTMVWITKWVFLLAVVLLIARIVQRLWRGREKNKNAVDLMGTCLFLAAAFLVPLLLLTSDESKSSVVGDVLVGPTVLILAVAIALFAGTFRGLRPSWIIHIGLVAIGLFSIWQGGRFAQAQYARHTFAAQDRVEVEKILKLFDRMATASLDMGWSAPTTGFDSSSDNLNYLCFSVMTYERSRRMIRPQEVLANSIFASPPEEQAAKLRSADLIVLTQAPPPPPGQPEFDFDKQVRELKPKFFEWCRQNYVELEHDHFDYPAHLDATVFIRPAVRVEGDADGWIGPKGAKIIGLAQVLRQRPEIELIGQNAVDRLPQPPSVSATLIGAGISPNDVPATLAYDGPNYRLELKVDPSRLPERGKIEIDLTFVNAIRSPGSSIAGESADRVIRLPSAGDLRRAVQMTASRVSSEN